MATDNLVDDVDSVDRVEAQPFLAVLPAYIQAQTFTSDPTWFLPDGDYGSIQDLAGVFAADWPAARIQHLPFLPTALAEGRRRIPTDWEALDVDSRAWLRLAVQYSTAALIVKAADPAHTEDFKIGSFTLKSDDTGLLADQSELLGYAALYFARVALPIGTVPAAFTDPFPRPVVRKASVCGSGRGRLFCGRLFCGRLF